MPIEWVRVKDPDTGHEITMSVEQARLVDAKPVDKPAVGPDGNPLPPKPSVSVSDAAAAKKGA